jgi:membrane protein
VTQFKPTPEDELRSLWSLGGLTVGQLSKKVLQSITADYILDWASALAFNFILALFPLLLFLLALFGAFASHGTALRSRLLSYLAQVLPPAAYQVVNRTMVQVTRNAGSGKLTFGIVLTLWFASGGMVAMISGLNGAYEVKDHRSWFKVRGIALALTVVISALIVVALTAVLAGADFANWAGFKYGLSAITLTTWRAVEVIVSIAFVTLSFSLIYYFGPDLQNQRWHWVTPGSLTGVLLWIAATFGFRAYLHFFNTYSETYGSLGAAMILLIWLYITGFAFLIGAEINAQIEHAAALGGHHPEAQAPDQKAA